MTYTVKFMAQLLFIVVKLVLHKKTSLKASSIVYKAGKQSRVTNTEFIKFTLSEGTYSIDNFNAKIKVLILQQRQGWEPPQIKYLKASHTKILFAYG